MHVSNSGDARPPLCKENGSSVCIINLALHESTKQGSGYPAAADGLSVSAEGSLFTCSFQGAYLNLAVKLLVQDALTAGPPRGGGGVGGGGGGGDLWLLHGVCCHLQSFSPALAHGQHECPAMHKSLNSCDSNYGNEKLLVKYDTSLEEIGVLRGPVDCVKNRSLVFSKIQLLALRDQLPCSAAMSGREVLVWLLLLYSSQSLSACFCALIKPFQHDLSSCSMSEPFPSMLQVRPQAEDEVFRVMKSGKRQKNQWKRMVTKVTFVGNNFTRKPPKYERFIRPSGDPHPEQPCQHLAAFFMIMEEGLCCNVAFLGPPMSIK